VSETLAQAAAREFGFNPSQARGFGGKWIKVGDVVDHPTLGRGTVKKENKEIPGKVTVRFNGDGEEGTSRLLPVKDLTKVPRPKKLTPAEKKARDERLDDQDRF